MEEGRKQLAASAGFRRLITVALHRGQQYEGMDSVQAELSARVMELAPAGMPTQQQVLSSDVLRRQEGRGSLGRSLGWSLTCCDPAGRQQLGGNQAETPFLTQAVRGWGAVACSKNHRIICNGGPRGPHQDRV